MPTSHPGQINQITSLLMQTYATSVLDIGIGFGKWGLLAREYLDISDGREKYDRADWGCRIDGIEAFPQYVQPHHRHLYTDVYVGNALDIVPSLPHRYDVTLMIDVLEHFSYEDGMTLLKAVLAKSRGVIISCPKDNGEQKAAFGNVFETHRFEWKRQHFKAFGPQFVLRNSKSLILYIGPDARKVQLRRYPALIRMYAALQSMRRA